MKKIVFAMACVLSLGIISTPISVFAEGTSQRSTKIISNKVDETRLNEIAAEYSGIDIVSKNFDRSIMNDQEQKLYDALLNYQYEIAVENKTTGGMSREQYVKYLEQLNVNSNKLRNAAHGWISTRQLGDALNIVINATLIAFGFGSISTMVKALGKEAAKKFIKDYVLDKVKDKLKALGLAAAAAYIGGEVVDKIISAAIDPGKAIAEYIDAHDKIKNNKFIELT